MSLEEERENFEKWWKEKNYPSEYSSSYLRNVIFRLEEEGDCYESEDIQECWEGWMGRSGLTS